MSLHRQAHQSSKPPLRNACSNPVLTDPYCNRPNSSAGTILDLTCLAKLTTAAKALTGVGARYGNLAALAGEGSNCWTGGVRNVSDTFFDSFYYSFQLSTMATHNVQNVVRQTFLGQIYQLVNATTKAPNPSYWIALLWRRLVGRKALGFNAEPFLPSGAPLHVSVHCSVVADGEVVAVAINFAANESYDLESVSPELPRGRDVRTAPMPVDDAFDVYLLSGPLHGKSIELNGEPLALRSSGTDLPAIAPARMRSPLRLPPASIAFVQTVAKSNGHNRTDGSFAQPSYTACRNQAVRHLPAESYVGA